MSDVLKKLKESSDPLDVELALVLAHWQSAKRKRGLRAGLGYEPRDINANGAVNVISSRVLKASTGFDEVDPDLSYEAIVLKHPKRFPPDVITAASRRIKKRSYWWVNHKQTFAQEVGGDYIWSPLTRSDGGKNEFYENMRRVRPGDVVFSFAKGKIQAAGLCTVPAVLAPKPEDFGDAGSSWSNEGWRVAVSFERFNSPLRPKDHMDVLAPRLPAKYSPIRSTGDGNQGAYLAAVPKAMAQTLIALLGPQWSVVDFGAETGTEKDALALEKTEADLEKSIDNRTDLTETEKLQLVRSRRGQGIYRKNLEGFEKRCRITGVANPNHLRASHIKPWRVSSNFEKLDGNNGLLLSPHVDHLFDRGYISFADGGAILVSKLADLDTLESWGIVSTANAGPFRPEQLPYLAFHRESVFKG